MYVDFGDLEANLNQLHISDYLDEPVLQRALRKSGRDKSKFHPTIPLELEEAALATHPLRDPTLQTQVCSCYFASPAGGKRPKKSIHNSSTSMVFLCGVREGEVGRWGMEVVDKRPDTYARRKCSIAIALTWQVSAFLQARQGAHSEVIFDQETPFNLEDVNDLRLSNGIGFRWDDVYEALD